MGRVPPPTHLYRLSDWSCGLLYIGTTQNVGARLRDHFKKQPWAADIADVSLHHFQGADRDYALAYERELIVAERPRFNRAPGYVPDAPWRSTQITAHLNYIKLQYGWGMAPAWSLLQSGRPVSAQSFIEQFYAGPDFQELERLRPRPTERLPHP